MEEQGAAQIFSVYEIEAAGELPAEVRVVLDPDSTSVYWPLEAGRCRFLGIGRAGFNGVIVVKSLFTVNAGDHKSAILRISPDIHFDRKGAAQLGVIFKQRVWHQTLRYLAQEQNFPEPVPVVST